MLENLYKVTVGNALQLLDAHKVQCLQSNPSKTDVFHCWSVLPQKPMFKSLLRLCLFGGKIIMFTTKTREISIKGEQSSGWSWACDAPMP